MWIIHGYGKMGHKVAEIMHGKYDFCTVDPLAKDADYAALAEIENFREGEARSALEGSALIDFSCPAGSVEAVEWASKNGVCVLVATTGHTEEQMERIRAASRHIPVLCTGNTSTGVLATIEMLHYAPFVQYQDKVSCTNMNLWFEHEKQGKSNLIVRLISVRNGA